MAHQLQYTNYQKEMYEHETRRVNAELEKTIHDAEHATVYHDQAHRPVVAAANAAYGEAKASPRLFKPIAQTNPISRQDDVLAATHTVPVDIISNFVGNTGGSAISPSAIH